MIRIVRAATLADLRDAADRSLRRAEDAERAATESRREAEDARRIAEDWRSFAAKAEDARQRAEAAQAAAEAKYDAVTADTDGTVVHRITGPERSIAGRHMASCSCGWMHSADDDGGAIRAIMDHGRDIEREAIERQAMT